MFNCAFNAANSLSTLLAGESRAANLSFKSSPLRAAAIWARALASATRAGPAWFGKLDRFGAVAQGKAADLVLLERNPLQDISATRSIDTVILNGRVYDRKALDGMLDDTRKKVAAWNAAATH